MSPQEIVIDLFFLVVFWQTHDVEVSAARGQWWERVTERRWLWRRWGPVFCEAALKPNGAERAPEASCLVDSLDLFQAQDNRGLLYLLLSDDNIESKLLKKDLFTLLLYYQVFPPSYCWLGTTVGKWDFLRSLCVTKTFLSKANNWYCCRILHLFLHPLQTGVGLISFLLSPHSLANQTPHSANCTTTHL